LLASILFLIILLIIWQKYKAFAAEVDSLQKVLKKKGAAAASEDFSKVEAALDMWLSEIDLPAAREM
jgi:hypothetical protein